jgi:NodT family efflux transporter outer membrane factor (OMF) lipoprotein
MRRQRWLVIVRLCQFTLCVGLAGGCVDTGGVRPKSQLLATTTLDPGDATRAAMKDVPWPDVHWWQPWQDPQLDRLIEQGIAHHPSLRMAQARVELAQAQARIDGASLMPQLDAGGDFSKERFARYAAPSPPGGYTVWNNGVDVALSYDLDAWGKNHDILHGALDEVRAAAAEKQGVQLALETAIVRAYVQLSLQYALRDDDQTIADQARATRDIVASRMRAGIGSQIDLSEAEAQWLMAVNQVELANQNIQLIDHQLAALVGEGPGSGETISRPQLKMDVPIRLPATLPADLVGHRPDIVALRWRVESANASIAAARADFYPNIDLVASASLAAAVPFGGFFEFLDKEAAGHVLGTAIDLPLFDAGRRQGVYRASVAGHDAAVEAYNSVVITAMQQVADQVVSLHSLQLQQQNAERAASEADNAYRLATRGYRNGITEYLQVLIDQATALHQHQQVEAIRASRLEAWALLMQALGGGVASTADKAYSSTAGGAGRHAT